MNSSWVYRFGLAMFAPVVCAQAPVGNAPGNSQTLEEVVVSAERRETSLQNTPVSVLAMSGDVLKELSVRTVYDLQTFLPNVSVGASIPVGTSSPNFSIRGVGQTSSRANSEKGVGLYIDDIYYPRSPGSSVALLDIDRVEVLRGPQGTLFGRNTTAGAIRYLTNKPVFEKEGRISVTAGTDERRDIEGMINLPISETLAFRAQAGYFEQDGYIKMTGTDRRYGDHEDWAIRGALRWKPNDNLTVDLGASHGKNKSVGSPGVITGVGLTNPAGFPIAEVVRYNAYLATIGQPPVVDNDPRWVTPDGYSLYSRCILDSVPFDSTRFGTAPNVLSLVLTRGMMCDDHRETETTSVSLDIVYSLSDNLRLRALTGFNDGDDIYLADYGFFGSQLNFNRNEMRSFSQELQLLGSSERFDWVAGLYYFDEDPVELASYRDIVTGAGGATVCCIGFDKDSQFDTKSYAAFAQATFKFTDALSLTTGVRYTYDDKSVYMEKTGNFLPPLPAGGSPQARSSTWDAVDYRVTLDYQWTDDFMTYATVSKGFKSGGFNIDITTSAGVPTIQPYDPEYVQNFEVGLRSEWLDNRLRANLTLFNEDFEDIVVQVADFSSGALQVLFVNAGETRLRGVEAELAAYVGAGISLNAAYGYTDQKWKSLGSGSPLLIASSCPGVTPLRYPTCAAQSIGRAPKESVSAGPQFQRSIGGGTLTLRADYAYKSSQFSDNNASTSLYLPSYSIANVRAQYESSSFWSVALFGTNIFDEYYYVGGTDGRTNILATRTAHIGEPRQWGVTLTARF